MLLHAPDSQSIKAVQLVHVKIKMSTMPESIRPLIVVTVYRAQHSMSTLLLLQRQFRVYLFHYCA